jgi:hypothetical protein
MCTESFAVSDKTFLVVISEHIRALYLEAWLYKRFPHEGKKWIIMNM